MKILKAAGVACVALIVSAHVGSPDVFFTGRAGPYDLRVTVRPPQVVPGIARVTVRTSADVNGVSIRPIFWRAGSRGAPSADPTRRLEGSAQTFEGSLWLMARGAYGVDVIVHGTRGKANVLVPVASVATARLALGPGLGALLAVLGVVLVAGLVNIVYKGAGESLVEARGDLDASSRRRARKAAAIAVPILALGLFGGARWWRAVDRDYQRTMHRPAPLALALRGTLLRLQATDTVWQPPRQPSAFVADHGKLMHLFLVQEDDARAFAHLHPQASDTSAIPAFVTRIPPLPRGRYHVYGDVVHETGLERTLVGSLVIADSSTQPSVAADTMILPDPDDAWFVGVASREKTTKLGDGSTMTLQVIPNGVIPPGREETIRLSVSDPTGKPAVLEPYLGMSAHGVVTRVDGTVYVHLHPMGTVTAAAQEAFRARDRGDTSRTGRLQMNDHSAHSPDAAIPLAPSVIEFPYAFPKGGSYRIFVQVKRKGQILTGAYAITVAEAASAP